MAPSGGSVPASRSSTRTIDMSERRERTSFSRLRRSSRLMADGVSRGSAVQSGSERRMAASVSDHRRLESIVGGLHLVDHGTERIRGPNTIAA
jgi:hypothetical protein